MRGNKGFTLAEVLITLVIIGVIGALTVPALIQNTQKKEYVSALKKAYSTLSQVTQQIIAEEGSPKGDDGWAQNTDSFYKIYKKYLNNAKECDNKRGCFAEKIKYMNGDFWISDIETEAWSKRLLLAGGAALAFQRTDKYCGNMNLNGSKNACGRIFVDLNGLKSPNTAGRDIFAFVLKEDGLYPAGCDIPKSIETGGGAEYTCKVLSEGAMNY